MFLDCVSYGDRNILDTLLVCFENEVDMEEGDSNDGK